MSFIKQVINMEITLLLLYCNPSPSPMKCQISLSVCCRDQPIRIIENAGTNNWYLEYVVAVKMRIIDQPVMDRYCLQSARLLSVLEYSHFLPHRTMFIIISEFYSYE